MSETYRDLRDSDVDDLWAVASQWPVVRQLGGFRWPPDRTQIASRCRPYQGDGFVRAICRNDRLIGTLGITKGSLGYQLHPDFHGQGIMTRAAMRALDDVFDVPETAVIVATTWHDNAPSDALLRKLGFCHWQSRYEHSLARGYPTLARHYRLPRHAWLEARAQLA